MTVVMKVLSEADLGALLYFRRHSMPEKFASSSYLKEPYLSSGRVPVIKFNVIAVQYTYQTFLFLRR